MQHHAALSRAAAYARSPDDAIAFKGLISNSWYGKFHGEMIWFHLLHYFGWGRGAVAVNATLPFWKDATEAAIKHAASQGYAGARWPKMTGPTEDMLIPDGPSGVGQSL